MNRIITTLIKLTEAEVRLRINPNGQNRDLFHYWQSSDEDMYLIYDPVINISIRNRIDKKSQVTIPLNRMDTFIHSLLVVYNSLKSNELYTQLSERELYINKAVVSAHSTKMAVFNGQVSFIPDIIETDAVVYRCIRVMSDNETVCRVVHKELQELINVLQKIDIHSLSMLAVALRQFKTLEDKIDRLEKGQERLINLLEEKL